MGLDLARPNGAIGDKGLKQQKTIVVFSSHVVRGTVGLRAAALALEALGNQVWSVPTTILSFHPGHGQPAGFRAETDAFAALCDSLSASPWVGEIDAVLCGYFASADQVMIARRFIDAVRDRQSSLDRSPATLVVDPVLGDHGRLYVPEEVARAIGDHLVPMADVLTPNRFELQWLTDSEELDDNVKICASAAQLSRDGTCDVLVTSAHGLRENSVAALYCSGRKAIAAEHDLMADPPNGLGDLTSALLTHHMLHDAPLEKRLERTIASVADVLFKSAKAGCDELALEANLGSLTRPLRPVHLRQMLLTRPKKR